MRAASVAASCAGLMFGLAVSSAAAPASGGSWGQARQVPGLAALNSGGFAVLYSVSCGSPGNCAAGGFYIKTATHRHAFVVSQRNGTWARAQQVTGPAFRPTAISQVFAVSCAPAGQCAAGGQFTDRAGHLQAFVVNERNGKWGTAVAVPGTARLNAGHNAEVSALSCRTAGSCDAGGDYIDSSGHFQVFVVSERSGKWGSATRVPGTARLNTGGSAQLTSLSCGSAGNCAVGGSYLTQAGRTEAFVVSERNGTWGSALEVPGTSALNTGGIAGITSLSCPSAGNCAAGGAYHDGPASSQVFVVDQRGGKWGHALRVPGSAGLNAGASAQLSSVSCASRGNCAAGGFYTDGLHHVQAFVVSERHGIWQAALEVPGMAALNTGGSAGVESVSCPSNGGCAAGGFYWDISRHEHAFVVNEHNGTWGTALQVPGTAVLNAGGMASTKAVSCAAAGKCSAGGIYKSGPVRQQAFVVSSS